MLLSFANHREVTRIDVTGLRDELRRHRSTWGAERVTPLVRQFFTETPGFADLTITGRPAERNVPVGNAAAFAIVIVMEETELETINSLALYARRFAADGTLAVVHYADGWDFVWHSLDGV